MLATKNENHYVVHLKLIKCFVNYSSTKNSGSNVKHGKLILKEQYCL